MRIYVGGYTGNTGGGIGLFHLDEATGELANQGVVAETENPSFLAMHPDGTRIYAVNEVGETEGRPTGRVSAFSVDSTNGALSFLNQQDSGGGAPCHVTAAEAGDKVYVANYSGGSIASFDLEEDGLVGPVQCIDHNQDSPDGANAHGVHLDDSGRFLLVPDLGLDRVYVYSVTPEGVLRPAGRPYCQFEKGNGPRHAVYHPGGQWVYVVHEHTSRLTQLSWESQLGELSILGTQTTLPNDFDGESHGGEIALHPSGKFLYVSNRGHDSVAFFSLDKESGQPSLLRHYSVQGSWPRHFAISASGKWMIVANERSDQLVVFRVNPENGGLEDTGHRGDTPKPACVLFAS